MRCAWQSLLDLLPVWMRDFVDKHGKDVLQEIRLRINAPPQLKTMDNNLTMSRVVTSDDLRFCINVVTKYSPWSVSTASKFYYTSPGGHRIGLCGNLITHDGNSSHIHDISSLCIRVARDFPGIANAVTLSGSVLILGCPGSGKTTMLRDYIRQLSAKKDVNVAVVDERKEIFPYFNNRFCFDTGPNTDIISGSSKPMGIEAVLRNMGPSVIAVDEITAVNDCKALIHAGWCGVDLIATAHAGSKNDLLNRPVYRPLLETQLFQNLLIMHPDKSWHIERITQ